MSTPAVPADPQTPPAPAGGQPAPEPVTPQATVTDRPEGVSEEEWQALGDPEKRALVRERDARAAAERELARRQATITAPQPQGQPPASPPPAAAQPKSDDGTPDIAALVRDAVAHAIQPFTEHAAQQEANTAAERIRDAVTTAATGRLHDPTDALAHIDLPSVTDGNGRVDPARVATALDDLLTRKPHLGQVVDPRRRPDPTDGLGSPPGGSTPPLDDRVKATLARMQSAAGVKPA